MKTYKIGKSDVEVSALCYGTDLIGSKIDRETSFKLFDVFYDRGGTFLDTANFYSSWVEGCSGGESETTIGEWMKERGNREKMQISSKLGFDYPGCEGGLGADEIERECEKSPKRLQQAGSSRRKSGCAGPNPVRRPDAAPEYRRKSRYQASLAALDIFETRKEEGQADKFRRDAEFINGPPIPQNDHDTS